MKTSIATLVIIITMAMLPFLAKSQAQLIPAASPKQKVIQDFGLGKITVTYSRPNVKGRVIFGGINPYGQVWRTGANEATTINFTENVVMEGQKVPAGTYSLFTIPEKDEWTIILNKTVEQWGAYSYNKDMDFLRVSVKPQKLKSKTESFMITFQNSTTKSADMNLVWDQTLVPVHLETDDDAKIVANIDSLMNGNRKPYYFNAIQYCYENNKGMNKALAWALEAGKVSPGPWYKLWEARIQLKLGDKKAAAVAAQAGIDLAKTSNDDEYVRLNKAVLDQASK
jgi:hypothetical protein